MNENDILWQVIYLDRDNGYKRVKGLFKTEEEANVFRDECIKERQYSDSFDIYRYDNDWIFYVKSVTRREVMNDRKMQYDKLMDETREKFWNHCDEHFVDCCREMLRWLDKRLRELADSEKIQLMKPDSTLYAPWQTFHGASKVFAFVRFEEQQGLSLVGQFAGKSLLDTIYVGIRHFNSCQAFLEWIDSFEDAVSEFVSKMREQRCEEYEEILLLPF